MRRTSKFLLGVLLSSAFSASYANGMAPEVARFVIHPNNCSILFGGDSHENESVSGEYAQQYMAAIKAITETNGPNLVDPASVLHLDCVAAQGGKAVATETSKEGR
jgi:hypothetical protein